MSSVVAWTGVLHQLLPKGQAWAGAQIDRLLQALAAEFSRLDSRAATLVDEADPLTTLELLPDWERLAGLPDACVAVADNIRDRQLAVARKISGLGGQTPAFFIDLAERLGVEVLIEERHPFVAGGANAGDPLPERCLVIHVDRSHPLSTAESSGDIDRLRFGWFTAGQSSAGDPLRAFGISSLECIIRRAAPAHTTVLFAYSDDPEPVLWFDFLENGD